MPFVAAAPLLWGSIIGGTAAAGGSIAASKIASHGQQNIANQQQQFATQLQQQRAPAYNAASNYYQQLLSGDPGAMHASIAPEANLTNQQYAGARQNLIDNASARGGALDLGLRNLESQRAGQLSNLYYGLRPQAASNLANMASGTTTSALSALQGASASSLGQQQLGAQAAQGIGGFLSQLFSTPGLFGGGGGTNPAAATAGPSGFPSAIVGSPFRQGNATSSPSNTYNSMLGNGSFG